MAQLFLKLLLFFAFLIVEVKSLQSLNVRSTCVIKGQVGFCNHRIYKGTYVVEGRNILRIVFSRVDNGVTFDLRGMNVPQLNSIFIEISNCPSIKTEDMVSEIMIEASGIKCHVSNSKGRKSQHFVEFMSDSECR